MDARARITDVTGLTYLTAPVGNLVQKRVDRSVQICKSARLVLSTWSANVDDYSIHELRLNGQHLASRFGQFHNYSFNSLDVPLWLLKAGTNENE
ncbi:MAG: hypothetical protein ACREIC_20010 [Limisphaerales bacterium]